MAVLAAALIALQIAITDDRITNAEWVAIAIAGLGALGVWAFPNRPPAGEPPRPDMSEQG